MSIESENTGTPEPKAAEANGKRKPAKKAQPAKDAESVKKLPGFPPPEFS